MVSLTSRLSLTFFDIFVNGETGLEFLIDPERVIFRLRPRAADVSGAKGAVALF